MARGVRIPRSEDRLSRLLARLFQSPAAEARLEALALAGRQTFLFGALVHVCIRSLDGLRQKVVPVEMSSFTCLMYHSLSDGRWPDTQYLKYTTTRRMLGEHLARLAGEGFTLGGFDDYLRRTDRGESVPERYCLLSFDDGHRSSLDIADVLAEHEAGATFFLTMNYCRDRDDFMNDAEIREIAERGFHIGAHGVSHRALSEMSADAMREELVSSKAWLEDILQRPVETMSLPAGMGSETVIRSAFDCGFRLVGDSREVANTSGTIPRRIHRYCVLASHGPDMVFAMASGSRWYSFKRALRAKLISLPKRLLQTYNRQRG